MSASFRYLLSKLNISFVVLRKWACRHAPTPFSGLAILHDDERTKPAPHPAAVGCDPSTTFSRPGRGSYTSDIPDVWTNDKPCFRKLNAMCCCCDFRKLSMDHPSRSN